MCSSFVIHTFLIYHIITCKAIDCINEKYTSGSSVFAPAWKGCPSGYSLVSCGGATVTADEGEFYGAEVQDIRGTERCYTHNGYSADGVHIVARCCDFSLFSVQCTGSIRRWGAPCPSTETQLGCSASSGSNSYTFYGAFPGNKTVDPLDIKNNIANTIQYDVNKCATTDGVGYGTCCGSTVYPDLFACQSVWSDISTDLIITVSCPNTDQFMAGCSAVSNEPQINQIEIDSMDQCIVRKYAAGTDPMMAVAICCTLTATTPPVGDPTIAPSSNNPTLIPTIFPTVAPITNNPTLIPSITTSLNPLTPPSLTITFGSERRYTISITINECSTNEDESECVIDEDKINNIIIAVVGDAVQLLTTEIVENEINILVAVVDKDYSLDKDAIEREMEIEYSDVDVTIEETEDEPHETAKTNSFSLSTIIIVAAAIGSVILIAIIAYLLYNVYVMKKKVKSHKKTIKALVRIVKKEAKQKGVNDDICNAEDKKMDDDDDDDNDDSLYDMGTKGFELTTGGAEAVREGDVGEGDDDEDDSDDSLYEVGKGEKKGENEGAHDHTVTAKGSTK